MDIIEDYDTDALKAERDAQDKKRALTLNRVREIMGTEGFSEVVNFLLDISNFNGNNYSTDLNNMVFMEGRRSVFHDMLGFLEELDPTYYARLLLERAKESQNG